MGAELVEYLPSTSLGVSTPHNRAEASNLSRYDGVRYGYRCENPTDLRPIPAPEVGIRGQVKRRILVGAFTLSAASYDQYFMKAQQVR